MRGAPAPEVAVSAAAALPAPPAAPPAGGLRRMGEIIPAEVLFPMAGGAEAGGLLGRDATVGAAIVSAAAAAPQRLSLASQRILATPYLQLYCPGILYKGPFGAP